MEIMGSTEEELESEDSGNFIKHDIKSKGIQITAVRSDEAGRVKRSSPSYYSDTATNP